MNMGKMQEIADELKKKFPEVNKKGGFFAGVTTYTFYGQSPKLDSFVNEEMGLSDNGFLFYYRCHDTTISFTNTYFYFSGKNTGNTLNCDESTIRPFTEVHQGLGEYLPIFRINTDNLMEIKLIDRGGYTVLPKTIYNLYFKYTDNSDAVATSVWHNEGRELHSSIIPLITDIGCKDNVKNLAKSKEENLDYESAISLWEQIGDFKKAKEVRRKMLDEKKVDQTIVHGDYVDDRDTIVKDSVVNKSNIGVGGKSKAEELREAKALLDEGIIDDEEFKQMKKEILGK